MSYEYILFVVSFIVISVIKHWGKPHNHKNEIDQPGNF